MMNLDALKNLNPKNPGAWPWPAKFIAFAAIFFGVVALGALLDWQGQWEKLQSIKQEEEKLKETFLAKKKEAINLDLIKKQLTETQESFGALLKQLPSKSEMDALLTDINQAGLGRGLQFELFRPGSEKIIGAFAEQPISIKVTGNYDDLGKFASDISMLPRIVTLNDIDIKPVAAAATSKTGSAAGGSAKTLATSGLVMESVAKTFRYLDEEEAAAAAAALKKKEKPAAKSAAAAPKKGGH